MLERLADKLFGVWKRSTASGSAIVFSLLVGLAFLIPISQFLSIRLLVVLVLLSLVVRKGDGRLGGLLIPIWDALLYLLILVVGMSYTEDRQTGLHVIETSLSLLVLRVAFYKIGAMTKRRLNVIFLAFAFGLVIASMICLTYAVNEYASTGDPEVFFFEKFTRVIDSHPTYLAYYLIGAITFGLYVLHQDEHVGSPLALTLLLVFLFFVLMLTGGTTAFASMLFVLAFFILKFLLEKTSTKHLLLVLFVSALVVSMFAFNKFNRGESISLRNDSWERLALWESALSANSNVFVGVGTGDYKTILNAYYTTHEMTAYAAASLNPHNQFMETYVANGLLGLACLLLMLGRPIYLSVKNGDALGTLVFFPFIIYGMTEVFLGRYQGVVFFALMLQCFIAYYQSQRGAFSLKRA